MRYVFDTSVLIHLLRNSLTWQSIDNAYQPFAKGTEVFISFASVAEILSIAHQANWGQVNFRWSGLASLNSLWSVCTPYQRAKDL